MESKPLYNSKSKPRITVEITPQQRTILRKHLEYGMMRKVFLVMIEDAVAMLEEFGSDYVVAMLARHISYRDYILAYGDNSGFTNPGFRNSNKGRAIQTDKGDAGKTETGTRAPSSISTTDRSKQRDSESEASNKSEEGFETNNADGGDAEEDDA